MKQKESIKFADLLEEEEELDEANAIASGNVVGYTAPLGAKGIGTDKRLEKGFWRDKAGKKIKTASPALHKENFGAMQDVDTPTKKLNMVQDLWDSEELSSDVKTDSPLVEEIEGVEFVNEVINEPKRKSPKDIVQLGIEKNGGVKNIVAVYNEATPEEKEYWGKWYHHAKENVQDLAKKYNLPFPITAAVVAVLSPGNKWKNNLLAADRLLGNNANPSEPPKVISGYPRQIARAQDILNSGDVGKVTGPKVTVFFQSLLSPETVEKHLVLDGHAINIWRGEKPNLKQISMPNKAERQKMLEDYQTAAEQLGVPVQAIQAVTWYIWKYTNDAPIVKSKVFDTSTLTSPQKELFERIDPERYRVLESLFLESVGFERISSELKQMESLEEIQAYAQERFKLIGKGGYRNVYDLGSAVLKVTRWLKNSYFENHKNTENKIEIDARDCLPDEFFPKIYAFDGKNYYWLIAEKVHSGSGPLFEKEMQKAILSKVDLSSFGLSLAKKPEEFFDGLSDLMSDDIPKAWKIKRKAIEVSNRWFKELLGALKKCGVASQDLHASNWGLRMNGEPVILDFGFDKNQELDLDERLMAPLTENEVSVAGGSPAAVAKEIARTINERPYWLDMGDFIKEYAEKNFQEIGRGVSRTVYAINDQLVLKVERREVKTVRQNAFEIKASECLGPELCTVIYEHDPDGYWLIAERVEADVDKTLQYFRMLVGSLEDNLSDDDRRTFKTFKANAYNDQSITIFIILLRLQNKDPFYQAILDTLFEITPWMKVLFEKVRNCKVDASDFHEENWGFRKGMSHPILIDYGFDTLEESLSEAQKGYDQTLMKKLGYKYVGKNHRLGSETFITDRDKDSSYQRNLVKKVNKNLDKSTTTQGRLHDPSAMGISLPKKMRG